MGTFFLIDQSLKGVGGHHFDYTHLISRAATQSKWKVVIGCHHKFQHQEAFPNCELRNSFRFTTYASCSSLVGIQDMVARRKQNRVWRWLGKLIGKNSSEDIRRRQEQTRRIEAFREDCHNFFTRPFHRDDVIFCTTLSDLEAEGLALFFRDRPDAKLANWHLQFHFPIFRGRTQDYLTQDDNTPFIKSVIHKLKTLAQDKIHFYVTSETLKDQYDLLGTDFESLAYPVSPNLKTTENSNADPSPNARLTFAGAVRNEKGAGQIEKLIHELESEFGNSVRFCLQLKKKKWFSKIKSLFRKEKELYSNAEIYQYPLSAEAYQSYIKRSDIGLLTTYDSETYFSRRAGILGEYLTAGVPVIVPAGCWLSDQVEQQQQKYLQGVIDNRSFDHFDVRPKSVANHSNGSTSATFDLENQFSQSSIPSRMIIIGFDVVHPSQHGNYVRVNLKEDESCSSSIVGLDRAETRRYVPFYLNKSTTDFSIELSPAFGSDKWQVANIKATLVGSNEEIPRSAVGLVAVDPAQTLDLTKEMIRQFTHYKKTTMDFSEKWFAMHDPNRTFDTLVHNSVLTQSNLEKAA